MLSKAKYSDFHSSTARIWLIVGVIVLNLTAYLLGCWWLADSREEYQERAKIESRNISRVLAQSIAHAFDKVELVLMDAEDEIASQIKMYGSIDNKKLAPILSSLQMRVPELQSLRASNAEGMLIYGSGLPSDQPINVSDDSHFPYLRNHPNAGTSIAKPRYGRINQAWVIKISRRYSRPDGSFGGVINGAIRAEQLLVLVPELDIGANGFISLRDSDLGIIFRLPQPGIGRDIGQRRVPQEYVERIQAQEKSGNFIAVSPNDDLERMVAFHKVGKWGLYISIGLASKDYLAQWRQEVNVVVAVEAVFTLLSILLGFLLYRYMRDRSEYVARLQEEQRVFRSLAEISSDWFWEQDSEYRFTHLSRDLSYRTDSNFGSVVGKARWEFAVEPGRDEWEKHMALLEAHQPFYDFEYSFIDRDGTKRTVISSGSPIFDASGAFSGYRGTTKDVTERREYEERTQNMAQYDSLTGIPNRALFYDRLTQAISLARRNQHRLALLYLDLDKFKPVNDTHGHDAGDRLLRMVTHRMEFVLRESDTLARLGGDEFVLIMPQIVTVSDAAFVAEKLLGVVMEPFHLEGVSNEVVVGASIGIAVFPEDADSPDNLVRSADQAMYCAKSEGNCFRLYADCLSAHRTMESL